MDFRFLAPLAALACLVAQPAGAAEAIVGYGLFAPAQITVPRGTRVVFRNEDMHAHAVASGARSQGFKLGEVMPGAAKALTLGAW